MIQRNDFFAHSENILIAMLTDKDSTINELALKKFLKQAKKKPNNIRTFTVPTLNSKLLNTTRK